MQRKIKTCLFCFILAIIFVFLFSFSTSPLYNEYYGGDSSQFQTIGEAWLEGKVPYKDTFDHKGPAIFLINTFGYLIHWRTGIMVIQILFLSITLYWVFKIGSLVSKKSIYGAFTVILTLVFLRCSYCDGNSVQEYALPFLAISTYYIVKFLLSKQKKHEPKWALIYGVSAGFCLLSQATSAIIIAAGVIMISIRLIRNKQWNNFWKNVGFGLVGFGGFCAPFLLYFAINGCLGEMFYAIIIFNAEYASKIGSWLHNATGDQVIAFLITFFPFISVFLTTIFAFARKKYEYAIFLLLCGLMEGYLFLSAQSFSQYAIPTLMQLPLFFNELYLLLSKNDIDSKFLYSLLITPILMVFYSQSVSSVKLIPSMYAKASHPEITGYEAILEKHIDEIQNSSFTAYCGADVRSVYLKYHLIPNNKFFITQWWHAQFDQKISNEIYESFSTGDTKYILSDEISRTKEHNINDILDEKYELIEKSSEFELYRLKEE